MKPSPFAHPPIAAPLTAAVPPLPASGKIDLNTVPSSMEQRAASWREKANA